MKRGEFNMRIMVIGCGKVGSKFANTLYKEGHEIIILDTEMKAFRSLEPGFNGITVTGVPIDPDVLVHAGIETVDAIAAVTPDDNVNIMVCQLAKEMYKVPKVIARIYSPDREHVFHHFGLETICPTNLTAETIRSLLFTGMEPKSIVLGNDTVLFRYETFLGQETIAITEIIPARNETIFGYINEGHFSFATEDLMIKNGNIIVYALITE